MKQELKIEEFIYKHNMDLVVAKSPINPNVGWKMVNTGLMLIKNTNIAHEFFEKVLKLNMRQVAKCWDADKYGIFTNGDQDSIVYIFETDKLFTYTFCDIIPWEDFNVRPYHFTHKNDQFFINHFAVDNKFEEIKQFANKFILEPDLMKKSLSDI